MKRESGFTLIELLIVVMVLSILSGLSVMGLVRSRAAANESSAIGALRTITAGQIAYSASCGLGNFAPSLTVLGVAPLGSPVAFLPPDLTSAPVVLKSGYRTGIVPSAGAVVAAADCNGTATQTGYYASSVPVTYGWNGTRSFASATPLMTIYQAYAPAAPAEPFAAPAEPIR